jgi:hypothetical protein
MKKLTSLLTLCLFVIVAKSQTPSLNTLLRFVNTPIADLTEEVILIDGCELTKSENVDSVVTLEFRFYDVTLIAKKTQHLTNEISLVCNKQQYDNLHKSLMQFKPRLITSEVNSQGHVVKTYWGENYGYKITIAPKSLFLFQVYNIADSLMRKLLESSAPKASSMKEQGIQGSNVTLTPIPLVSFTNLLMPYVYGQINGKIAVRIKIDTDGNVTDVTPGVKGTTLNDRELWQKCKESMMAAKATFSEPSSNVQLAVVVFNFK